jgi:hypothetical protein
MNVVTIDNNVAHVDTDAELNSLLLSQADVLFCHEALNIHCAAHSIHGADELREQPVAHCFDDTPAIFIDLGVN